jgi:hypothetical protein
MKNRDKSGDKKKRRSDDLDEMREAFRQHKERAKGGGSSKNDFDKLEDGKNLRRWLPIPGRRKFYTEGWTHFDVGPNERAVRCIDEEHIDPERGLPQSGTKCPRCKRFLREQARINSEYQKGDEEGQAEWGRMKQKYCARHQFYSNTLREDDEGDFEVKITTYGPQVWGQLMNYYVGDDTNVGDFTSPESGTWMNVKKVDKGGNKRGRRRRNIEYKVYAADGPDISEAWDTIKEALHDLDAAVGKVISVEEFVAIEKGIDVDKDRSDDDDGRSRRRRSRDDDDGDDRRRKSRDDDDDDDDDREDDRDDDDDDEEEDEEDRPVRVKKSRLAEKRRRRDD